MYQNPKYFRTLRPEEVRRIHSKKDKTICEGPNVSNCSYVEVKNKLSLFFLKKPANEMRVLCQSLDPKESYPHPIYHLINFSSGEGLMGPKAVKEIAGVLNDKTLKEMQGSGIFTPEDLNIVSGIAYCFNETAKEKHGYIQYF
jgi:hypothetical protein